MHTDVERCTDERPTTAVSANYLNALPSYIEPLKYRADEFSIQGCAAMSGMRGSDALIGVGELVALLDPLRLHMQIGGEKFEPV